MFLSEICSGVGQIQKMRGDNELRYCILDSRGRGGARGSKGAKRIPASNIDSVSLPVSEHTPRRLMMLG